MTLLGGALAGFLGEPSVFRIPPPWVIGAYGGCMFFIAAASVEFYEPKSWRSAVPGGVFVAAGLVPSSVIFLRLLG